MNSTQASSNDSDVQQALNTVKAILAQQGVELNAGADASSIEQLLAQAQLVDDNLKVKNQAKSTALPELEPK